jgi:signal transduction histidine kinase
MTHQILAPSADGSYWTEAAALGDLIDRTRAEIEQRWLERVEIDIVKTPGVSLTHLRDGMPDYLAAMAQLLHRCGQGELLAGASSAWVRFAREHGVTRVRIGFDITQLIHEFVVLRHVIREIVAEHGGAAGPAEAMLADVLDAAISASVHAYVEARDAELRSRQAENIGFLTHELRNPLTAAMAAAAQLRPHVPPGAVRFADMVDRNHRRIHDLIDSTLLTQKLEAGKMECRPTALRLGELLDGAIEHLRDSCRRKGLHVSVTYDPSLRLCVDPMLTRSALQNVL